MARTVTNLEIVTHDCSKDRSRRKRKTAEEAVSPMAAGAVIEIVAKAGTEGIVNNQDMSESQEAKTRPRKLLA